MKKRFLAMFLALALCAGLTLPALAAEGKTVTTPDGKYTITNVLGQTTLAATGEDAEGLNGVTVYLVPPTGTHVTMNGATAEDETWYTIYEVNDGVLELRDAGIGMYGPEDEVELYSLNLWRPERVDVEEAYFHDGVGDLWGVGFGDNGTVWFGFVKDGADVPTGPESGESTESAPAVEFTDLPNWCAAEAQWAADKGITNGYGSLDKFAPGVDCTHTHILTFLYRAAREDGEAASAADMDAAVAWAKEKGMIDDSFDGSKPCTRSQAVYYIWQALGSLEAEASSFTDVPADAPYAKAVDWAVENGITNGDGSPDTFAPDKVCTRGHIACFLYRAYKE